MTIIRISSGYADHCQRCGVRFKHAVKHYDGTTAIWCDSCYDDHEHDKTVDCYGNLVSEHILLNEVMDRERAKRRAGLESGIKKFGLQDRAVIRDQGGTIVVDGKYWYYCQSKKARVQGRNKFYQMRGFAHFVETFIQAKGKQE